MTEQLPVNIKLICSDIDGTLLPDGTMECNPELFDVILRLKRHGIHFVAASGRQIVSIEKVFAPIRDQIFYIAENGTYLGCYGRELALKAMGPEEMEELVHDTHRLMPECEVMVSCPRMAYTDSKNPVFLKWMLEGYCYSMEYREDFSKISEPFMKVALYQDHMPEAYKKLARERWGGRFQVVTSGDMWIDIMRPDASKGTAVRELQESLFITPEETMAFGDQQNDIEMLRRASYSFAVANALPEAKAAARFLAESNQEDGVLKVLKSLLEKIEGESACRK